MLAQKIDADKFERETLEAEEILVIIRNTGGEKLIPEGKSQEPAPPAPKAPAVAATQPSDSENKGVGNIHPGDIVPDTA